MPNATREQLENAFLMYFEEMQRCHDQNLGWALVHLVVCMPDICAALEYGQTSAQRYEDWCATWMTPGPLNQWERYQIRCKLLHEGSSLPAPRNQNAVIRWDNFRFMPPGSGRHGESEGRTLLLDVGVLHGEVVAGMHTWFAAVEAGTTAGAANVTANLQKLVTVEARPTRDPTTFALGAYVTTTASPPSGPILIRAVATPAKKQGP
jgi:hypothetical protein